MAKIMNFSTEHLRNVFAVNPYEDYSRLMYDTGMGVQKVDSEQANAKIREVMFQVLEIEPTSDAKVIRKAFRRHKVEVFEVIEETVENLLRTGWGENPFFNQFVEIKSLALGDTNEFYVEDECILSVSELSGNHHDIIRQRLAEGSTYKVKTSWYGIKIYAEYERFMAGRIDWSAFINKIYEAFDKMINDMVYQAIMAAGTKVLPESQFNKSGALSDSTRDTLIELVEDVQMATGDEVVIMGTKTALSKLTKLVNTEWISNSMKEERHTTGRVAIWEGIRLVEIPQAFAQNDTTKKLVDNKKLLVMPLTDNKFIKIYNEGEEYVNEVTDSATNKDMTIEFEYMRKMGIATIIGKKFGMWTIAG